MRLTGLALVVAIAVLAPHSAAAQTRFGMQVSVADDMDVGLGMRLRSDGRWMFPRSPVSTIVSFDVFFPGGDVTYFELNGNMVYNFNPRASAVRPYVGSGLHIARIDRGDFPGSSDSELGLNVVGGLAFPAAGRAVPFVEVKLGIGGGEQLMLSGGFHF